LSPLRFDARGDARTDAPHRLPEFGGGTEQTFGRIEQVRQAGFCD
jgi:hypothetical protein